MSLEMLTTWLILQGTHRPWMETINTEFWIFIWAPFRGRGSAHCGWLPHLGTPQIGGQSPPFSPRKRLSQLITHIVSLSTLYIILSPLSQPIRRQKVRDMVLCIMM